MLMQPLVTVLEHGEPIAMQDSSAQNSVVE